MIIIRSIIECNGWHVSLRSSHASRTLEPKLQNQLWCFKCKKDDIPTRLREVSNSAIEQMHNDRSEVRVTTFYGPHGIYDTEANMNDLETGGYYVVWGWKVTFEF